MITNTRVPQDCCKGCRWNQSIVNPGLAQVEERGFVMTFPTVHKCNLRVKAMFTPDCAFSPEREAFRKQLAHDFGPRAIQECFNTV